MEIFKLTDKATSQLLKLRDEEEYTTPPFLRIAVKGGGCSGLSYDLSFDGKKMEGDELFEENGIEIVIDKKSILYLIGTELDFTDGLNGRGFKFSNPNATRSCGCGESFSI